MPEWNFPSQSGWIWIHPCDTQTNMNSSNWKLNIDFCCFQVVFNDLHIKISTITWLYVLEVIFNYQFHLQSYRFNFNFRRFSTGNWHLCNTRVLISKTSPLGCSQIHWQKKAINASDSSPQKWNHWLISRKYFILFFSSKYSSWKGFHQCNCGDTISSTFKISI